VRRTPSLPRGVFILHHVKDGDDAEAKLIGAYSTKSAAQRAITRLRSQPGFREYPDSFSMEFYGLDEDNWREGFVTVTNVSEFRDAATQLILVQGVARARVVLEEIAAQLRNAAISIRNGARAQI
jgi:hypothetical protein